MAHINLYTFQEGQTSSKTLFASSIPLDTLSYPETKMSSLSYFSVEGRTLTVSFFNDGDALQTNLIDNRYSLINSKYREVLNIFAEVVEGSDVIFSGVLNSSFNYDDYEEEFTDVVIMEGLHCFIKYHLEAIKQEVDEPYFINLYPPDEDKKSYGEKIDLEALNLGSRTDRTPLKRYFYNFLVAFNYNDAINGDAIVNLLDIPLFDYYFPMRITNTNLVELFNIGSSLTNTISPFERTDIDLSDVAKQIFTHRNTEYPITNTSDAWADNKVFKNNWDGSIEPYYLTNGEVNPKYYFMRKEMWVTFNTYTKGVGDVDTTSNYNNDNIYIIDKWFVYNVREIVPYSVDDLTTRDYAYLKQRVRIKKLRFIKWNPTGTLYYLGEYSYKNGIDELLHYYYYGGGAMDESDKEIISSRLVNGEDLGYTDSVISRTGIPRMCTWRWYCTNYLTTFGLPTWYDITNSTYQHDNFYYPSPYVNGLTQELDGTPFSLTLSLDGQLNKISISGEVCLDSRALVLNGFTGDIKNYLKTLLTIFNITILPINNGNIVFVEKLRDTLDEDATIFYLDETSRTSTVGSSPNPAEDGDYDLLFYPEPIKGIITKKYTILFSNFALNKQFTSYKYSFNTEPKINDIIVFRNKQYWINSIKLSDDYESYIVKAYEVRNELS